MGVTLRVLALALVGLALLPAGALAATVDRDTGTGVITIVDGARDDRRHHGRAPRRLDIVGHAGGGLVERQRRLRPRSRRGRVPAAASSIAVDLGGGNDRFSADGVSSPISVAGGTGNDDIETGGGNDVLAGGTGNDTLTGDGGVDDYFGETGDDTIEARDGNAERISCGAGTDEADNDFIDIIAECERGIDNDSDGFSSAVDCNDGAGTSPRRAPRCSTTASTRTATAATTPTSTGTATASPSPATATTPTRRSGPTRSRSAATRSTRTATGARTRSRELGAVVSNQWASRARRAPAARSSCTTRPRAPASS